MTIPTFAPSRGPSFGDELTATARADVQSSHKGYELSRPLGLRPLPSIPVTWKALTRTEMDEIVSFFKGLNGSRGPFYYTPPQTVTSPNGMTPTLSEVTGGSLTGQGTYYVQFTWYRTSGGLETLGSKEASFAVADNKLLTVTVPVLELGVTEWRVYVGATSGDCELQSGTVTTRTWTMDTGGRDTGGANPPTTNTLQAPRLFTYDGSLREIRRAPNVFALRTSFQEQTAAT